MHAPVTGQTEGGKSECDFTSLQFTAFNIKIMRSSGAKRGIWCCRPRPCVSRSWPSSCGYNLLI